MKTLMIVDDSNIIRNRIERLQKKDIQVVAKAGNGEQAIAMFKHYRPDIVTMDITMPRMDGLECIKQLIAIDPKVTILVVSALSDKEIGINALRYGARGFICKPFTEYDLDKAMNRILEDEDDDDQAGSPRH